ALRSSLTALTTAGARHRPAPHSARAPRSGVEALEHRAAATEPQAGGAGVDHRAGRIGVADPAGGLDTQPAAHGPVHRLDGAYARPAGGVEPRGGLDQVGAGLGDGPADGLDPLIARLVAQRAVDRRTLEDHFD